VALLLNPLRLSVLQGVPSLYSDLKPLYNQPGKADIMDEVFRQFETSLRKDGRLPSESR
jgi:hypothetical protein